MGYVWDSSDEAFSCPLLLVLIIEAHGVERIACEAQPRDDGREWHYRTKVPGYSGDVRGDRCWYVGERMKPRDELRWSVTPTVATDPPKPAVVSDPPKPAADQSTFEHR